MEFRCLRPWLCLLAVGLFVGCDSTPKPLSITGTVTLDGQPVVDGHLRFEPVDTTKPPGGGIIKDGKYTGDVFPGSYKVQIRAPRPAKRQLKQLPGPGEDAVTMEESIPARYNENTELTADVSPEKLVHDFSLQTN